MWKPGPEKGRHSGSDSRSETGKPAYAEDNFGRRISFVYDDLYRLTGAAGLYGSISYAYDRTGNRLSRTENGLTDTYAYAPGTGRLTEIAGTESKIFSYDAAGNITGMNSRSFVYDQNSRLIRAAENGTVSGEYVYNAFGQRAVKTAGGETTVFLYGSEGNLIAEADEKGRIVSEHIWLNGQLLASFKSGTVTEAVIDIDPDTLNLASKGMMTCFIELPEGYDVSDIMQDSVTLNETVCAEKAVVGDYDSDGIPDLTVKFDREQVCALLEPGEAVEITVSGTAGDVRFSGTDTVRVIGKNKGKKKDGIAVCEASRNMDAVYFYHMDHLGTPQAITDEEGNILWQADYKPFGEVMVTASSVENSFRFPGQYFDEETGLHYNWHRYYDPGTGRYLTPDPIGLGGGVNLYGYVGGNPINRSDPFGLIELILVGSNVKNPDFFTNIANAWANENTEVVQIRSLDEFQDTLRNHKSIEKLIYLGHAGNNRLFLSPTGILRTEDVAGLETKNVLPGAKIDLNGCHTAESDTKTPLSITAVFARHFKRDVSGYISGLSFGLPVYNIFDDDTLQPLFILFPSYPRGRQITVFGE